MKLKGLTEDEAILLRSPRCAKIGEIAQSILTASVAEMTGPLRIASFRWSMPRP
jgi:hypothetical protein